MPFSRRRIDLESLASFGATPINSTNNTDSSGISKPSVTNDFSPIGIRIHQWEISTQTSTIGNEKGMEKLTALLEDVANLSTTIDDENKSADTGNQMRRRMCPPEITFLDAQVSLKHNNMNIRFSATDALLEWAEAHRYLDHAINEGENCRNRCRGVQILQTKDAKSWSKKTSEGTTSSQFYYDWTFASPYAGSIIQTHEESSEDETCSHITSNMNNINNRTKWRPLSQSLIPFHLLQDTSQPILLYDDIPLFEDDLHDNGDVSLNIKLRVMPHCWYVLLRLFVRVDHVCLKAREVRMFCYFGEADPTLCADKNLICRDVVWRETMWDDLLNLGLPTDPARWREGENAGDFARLIGKLPVVELPTDLPRYSSISL